MSFEDIIVNRRGKTPDSFMMTEKVIGTVSNKKSYKIELKGLLERNKRNLEHKIAKSDSHPPRATSFEGHWVQDKANNTNNANLLGGFGILRINNDILDIPENIATYANLDYYGAKLIKVGDFVNFETEAELPVTIMNIGKSYVDDYLKIENLGGGSYIEYHDRPHFHLPLDSNAEGHMIIGCIKDRKYTLSAYKIPFGYGIYTPPNLLHADAYLTGRHIVVYSVTKHFSTVLLKTKNDELVDVNISK
jgi:hypothetical protein